MNEKSTKRTALLIAALSSFLTPFMGSSVNIALPTIAKELGMSAVSMSMVATLYLLSTAVFLVPMGKLADLVGRKKIFGIGSIIYLLSSTLCGFSNTAVILLIGRIIQGLGSAMVFGTGMAIISSLFPPGERGKALGINTAVVYLGLSTGPFLGGLLTQYLGWRSIFLFNIPFGLVIIFLIYFVLKGEWKEEKGKFDFGGSIIYGLSLVLLMYGFSHLPSLTGYLFLIISIVCFVAFVYYELRHESPVINISLLKENKVFTYSSLAALINYSATFAIVFLLSLYLQYLKGMSPRDAGMIILAQPIVMALVSPLAGILADKFDSKKVSSAGMAISAIGLFLFTFFNENTSLGFIIGNLILLGLGFALFSSPNTTTVMASVERKHYGVASSMLGTMRLVGQMLSVGIAMMVISIFIGKAKIQPENYPAFLQSMKVSFIIFTALSILGIFAALARNKHGEKAETGKDH